MLGRMMPILWQEFLETMRQVPLWYLVGPEYYCFEAPTTLPDRSPLAHLLTLRPRLRSDRSICSQRALLSITLPLRSLRRW